MSEPSIPRRELVGVNISRPDGSTEMVFVAPGTQVEVRPGEWLKASLPTAEPQINARLEEAAAESARQLRHSEAILASDIKFLRDSLVSAATRFSDLADMLATEGHHEHVGFMRASAARYLRAAKGQG